MGVPVDYYVWGTMLKHYQRHMPNLANVMLRYKTNLSTIQNDLLHDSLIRQLYHFATYFNRVLLQLVGTDIENSLFKYTVSYRHLTFMIETFELLMKSCKNLICYPCILNVQLHVHLKKWTLKFKLLYLRTYLCYLNKIRGICCVNTHIKSLKFWLKSILPWLKYSIFLGDCFLLAHPVDSVGPEVRWVLINLLASTVTCTVGNGRNEMLNFVDIYM